MNWMDGFNRVVNTIEDHLEEELDYQALADILGYSAYHFQRLFMMVAGISVAEYVRCRRLSRAAAELQGTDAKVVDVALKYGYSSPNSFVRAFKAMHGVAPSKAKEDGVMLKAFAPLAFTLNVSGAVSMDYRVTTLDPFRVVGRKLSTTMENGESYRTVPAMWQDFAQNGGPAALLPLMDAPPFGILGVSDYNPDLSQSEFDYYIGVSSTAPLPDGMGELWVPTCTWAVFPFINNDSAEAIQQFQQRVVMEWLPASGYQFAKAPDVELYNEDGSMEIWLPVTQ